VIPAKIAELRTRVPRAALTYRPGRDASRAELVSAKV
jgi:hypothetical protein